MTLPSAQFMATAFENQAIAAIAASENNENIVDIVAELQPSEDSAGAEEWIDLAFTNWQEADDARLLQYRR
tara:strand:- start:246 stop:458 length:213 start_codon:yes stop_codon:yes gene_type:complete